MNLRNVEVDTGIKAADEGRVVSAEEVPKLIRDWIAKFSSGHKAAHLSH
jgi:predicted transcriptional regulator